MSSNGDDPDSDVTGRHRARTSGDNIMDDDRVVFMGSVCTGPIREEEQVPKTQTQTIPEIEIKLESSDDEVERSEQIFMCSIPGQRARDGPNRHFSGNVPGDHNEPLRGVTDFHSPSATIIRPIRKRKSTSEVWEFFCRDPTNICRAVCSICQMSVSRGKLGGNFGTTALKRHLECKHPLEWAQRRSMRLQRADGEEEEEEAFEDEEEKDETYQILGNASNTQYSCQKTLTARDNHLPPHDSLKIYEIIDSSEDEEDKEKVPTRYEDGIIGKRKSSEEVGELSHPDSRFVIQNKDSAHLTLGLDNRQTSNQLSFCLPHLSMVPPGTRRRKSTSAVWQFFYIDRTNICRAVCTLCQTSVSRGKQGGHFGTSALMRHLEGKHPSEWGRGKVNKPKSGSVADVEDEDEEESDEQMADLSYGHSATPDFSIYSDMSGGMSLTLQGKPLDCHHENEEELRQNMNVSCATFPPSFKENLLGPINVNDIADGKYPPGHPRAQSWNRSVTELLCEMALPYSFISSRAFQKFMARVDPQYLVPRRSFFSGKAVPQLYEAVCEKIVSVLKRSESPHVHLATHLWSNDLTMDYLALTAHWAVVDPGQSPERRHALLCVKRFPKEFLEGSIQQELIRQMNVWISPNALSPGFFISSGELNLSHVIQGAGYTSISCFSHALNTLVKDFLQSNRYIASIITVAKKVCSHFLHSARARRILSDLQYQNNLPKRSLKLETAPHWTSTFYMLQRLLEQQRAVQQYSTMQKGPSMDILLTSSHWSLMASLVDLLQPFEMATREVSANKSSLSLVLPQLRYLHIFLRHIRGHFESKGDTNAVVLADSFALKLSTDYGVNEMFQKEEYVLSTLLDPRFKGRIEAILPPDSDIDHWKQVLVRKVKEVMSSFSSLYLPLCASRSAAPEAELLPGKSCDVETSLATIVPQWRRNVAAPPIIHKEKSLIEHLESAGLLASKSTGASLSTESHSACVMVERYLQDDQTIGAKEDPLVYWQKRTCLWPALTKLAIMYLTCPPSGVSAQSVFQAPHVSDGQEGMEHITFLKVNLENFPDYDPPPLISSDHEAEHSTSDLEI